MEKMTDTEAIVRGIQAALARSDSAWNELRSCHKIIHDFQDACPHPRDSVHLWYHEPSPDATTEECLVCGKTAIVAGEKKGLDDYRGDSHGS